MTIATTQTELFHLGELNSTPETLVPPSPAPVPGSRYPVFRTLTALGASYVWNHAVCVLLGPAVLTDTVSSRVTHIAAVVSVSSLFKAG